jgi:hypothetical protein
MAAVSSPIVFLAGLLIGWQHWGFSRVFTESLPIMVLAVVLGVLSAHLGGMFLVGFALGDFLLAYTSWSYPAGIASHLLRVRIPLLIEYGLLSLLSVNIPILTKALISQLPLSPRISRTIRFAIAVIGHALLTYVLVYFWTQMAAILIRPVFTWVGSSPTVAAVQPLQASGSLIAFIAVLASLLRMGLQGLTAFQPEVGSRLDALQKELASASPVLPATERVHPWVKVTIRTVWATLLLSGMFTNWLDPLLLGALILFLQAARSDLIRLPIGSWRAAVERVPLLFRLAGGMFIVYYVSQAILQWQMRQTNTFRPIVLLTAIALLILFVLNPGLPGVRQRAKLS